MRRGAYAWLLSAAFLSATYSSNATVAPADLFEACEHAFASKDFAPLRDVLTEDLRERATDCLRLNDEQFVLVVKGMPDGNFHYCDLRASPVCEEDRAGFRYPLLEKVLQFSGAGEDRFVLWRVSHMRRGEYTEAYYLFDVVPKSEATRGYVIYLLTIGGRKYMIEGGGDPCGGNASGVAQEITQITADKEGTPDVELRFTARITTCADRQERMTLTPFRLRDGKFSAASASAPAPR